MESGIRKRDAKEGDGYVCNKSEAETIRYATEEEIDALHRAIEKEGKMLLRRRAKYGTQ